MPSLCAKLITGTMWEWFTKEGALKENYIIATQHETSMKIPKQNLLELEEYARMLGLV
jgi:hypothetical protein